MVDQQQQQQDDTSGEGGKGGEPTHQHSVDEERIADRVWQKVKGLLGPLIADASVDDGGQDGAGKGGQDDGGGGKDGGTPTPDQVEGDMEQKVRALMGKISAETDHEREHERIKQLAESAPVSLTRAQRFWWGEGQRAAR